MNDSRNRGSSFDQYAGRYEEALGRGLSVSGENREFFSRGRIAWLARRFREMGRTVSTVLDFGCGTGDAAPHFLEYLGAERVIGVDVSRESLQVAISKYGSERVLFVHADDHRPAGDMDLVFCNGVFHHIPAAGRAEKVRWVFDCLKPGGLFAFWDNTPWKPGARLVMKRIPFDRDAVMIWPAEARRLLGPCGFDVLRTDFQFVFPRALGFLRGLEPFMAGCPLGAQYLVLSRKPA